MADSGFATFDLSATTRLFGLLGHPVHHSLSPAMHNAAFRALGMDACYLAFDTSPEDLASALAGARVLGVAGLNATVPHKERTLALAAQADSLAVLAGAANTLCPVPGGWKAYNTDVMGFLQALAADLDFDPTGRRCLVLGAGGAARAAVVGLASRGAQEICISNRNRNRAVQLLAELEPARNGASLYTAELADAPKRLRSGDLVVSATPLGLSDDGCWPWDPAEFRAGVRAYDMAYRGGRETPLVEQARAAGLQAVSGRSMLLHQGALAFELWTGRSPPLEVMAAALEQN
jgi:shikimate dehydrogenase